MYTFRRALLKDLSSLMREKEWLEKRCHKGKEREQHFFFSFMWSPCFDLQKTKKIKTRICNSSFSNFSCRFLNPNYFFQFEFEFFKYIRFEKLQDSVLKIVWINCSSDLKNFAKFSTFKSWFCIDHKNNFFSQ